MKHALITIWLTVCVFMVSTAKPMTLIETVPIGNCNNLADSTGFGEVAYEYNIGKYEVTAGQYTDFLNAVAATDTYGLYNTSMWTDDKGCKIERIGSSGSYTYSVADNWANRPVNYVNWGDAARFANWLHNGQPTGTQNIDTTESGAYTLNGATSDAELLDINREADWKWAVTSEDEWYKAAYHKNDGATDNYFKYPTGSDNMPSNDLINPDPGNNATYYVYRDDYTIGSPYWRTEVGAHENSDSPYGTFDQGGNILEWNEAVIGSSRGLRGGSFHMYDYFMTVTVRDYFYDPSYEQNFIGFRVVQVPACPSADLTGDCFVDMADFAVIAQWWLDNCEVSNDFCDGADLDLSGEVSMGDLLTVADQWLQGKPIETPEMTWVYVNASGVPGHEGFTGEMSKYETTNDQFAHYLNAALASGDIYVSDSYIKGNSAPYEGLNYYQLDGPGITAHGATHGGKSRIIYNGTTFTVESGYENHPVTYVSWYGAASFADYYGWQLPTEWQWHAVASYTDDRLYATGALLYDSVAFLANYRANGSDSEAPNDLSYHSWFESGTSEAGYFGLFGYGLADMAGNAREWTSSLHSSESSDRVIRGGNWISDASSCMVENRGYADPNAMMASVGFRVSR